MTVFTPLPVEPAFTLWRGHRIANYQTGSGDPVLLVHSISAGSSTFEFRYPFVSLGQHFHVHAFDLLGFGRSDRPARRYQPEDYIDQIIQALRQIGQPTAIIASSLSATYAVKAALRAPELVRSMILICPTGLSVLTRRPGPVEWALYRTLRGPAGDAVFQGLTTRRFTRYFLEKQAYADPARLTEETIDGFYRVSHQPGAKYAPICFVTGLLNCSIAETLASSICPSCSPGASNHASHRCTRPMPFLRSIPTLASRSSTRHR